MWGQLGNQHGEMDGSIRDPIKNVLPNPTEAVVESRAMKRIIARIAVIFSAGSLVCCLTIIGLTGCSALMPHEIQVMERQASANAAWLRAEKPEAFRTMTVGDRKMHYVEVTDADPKPLILFVHGSPGDWSGWSQYLTDAELQQRAHLIAVDRPGFGDSDGGKVERSLFKQCEDIAPLLDKAVPGQRVIVVGHSFGGPVVSRLAMDYSGKITDVVILAGSIDPEQEHTKWYQYPADWTVFSWMLPDGLVVANREIRALKPELSRMLPLWSNITQRVTVIQGEKDDLVPPENADFAERMLTRAASVHIVRIPEMNHFIPWTRYEVVK